MQTKETIIQNRKDLEMKEILYRKKCQIKREKLQDEIPILQIKRMNEQNSNFRKTLSDLTDKINNNKHPNESIDKIERKDLINKIARNCFEIDMKQIGGIILYRPGKRGENYIIQYGNIKCKIRVRGTFNDDDNVTLIRAKYSWFNTHYAPDYYYIIPGVRHDNNNKYVISNHDAKSYKKIVPIKSKDSSYILSSDDIVKCNNTKIFG